MRQCKTELRTTVFLKFDGVDTVQYNTIQSRFV